MSSPSPATSPSASAVGAAPTSGKPVSVVTSVKWMTLSAAGAMPRIVMSDAGLKAITGRPTSGPSVQFTFASAA